MVMFGPPARELLPLPRFVGRLARIFLLALGIISAALILGVLGYHWIAKLAWVDSLLNASMILTGMGPVDPMRTTSAKLFAAVYALLSGVVFLSSMGIVLAPVFHRLMHWFHLEETETETKKLP